MPYKLQNIKLVHYKIDTTPILHLENYIVTISSCIKREPQSLRSPSSCELLMLL